MTLTTPHPDEDGRTRLTVGCPVCDSPAHVVISIDGFKSRWCCTTCLSIGEAPIHPQATTAVATPTPIARA